MLGRVRFERQLIATFQQRVERCLKLPVAFVQIYNRLNSSTVRYDAVHTGKTSSMEPIDEKIVS